MTTQSVLTIVKRTCLQLKTGLSRSAIYTRLDPKSPQCDPSFPRPVSLGARAVGWYSHEIDEWLANRPRRNSTEKKECGHA